MICIRHVASSFLCLLLTSSTTSVDAFSIVTTQRIHVGTPHSLHSLGMVRSRSMPNIEKVDDDGNVVQIPVRNIERDWTWNDYKSTGEFSVDLFVPEDRKNIKGCAFFMHGFSQYPVAYSNTLMKAAESSNVAIIAVETGVTSKIVLEGIKDKPDGAGRDWPQVVLQRAVSEDTKQCIRMVLEGDDIFAEYGVTKSAVQNKIAVMGHSMGGGLCFPVAADFCKDIDYVFTMAPAYGVKEYFDPIDEGVKRHAVGNSMLIAGGWDIIAPAKKIEKIAATSNKEDKHSSIYIKVKQGLHTGFEDRLVLFNIPLFNGFKIVSFIWNILGLVDVALFKVLQTVLSILRFNKKRTGQLAGSRALMEYFLISMVDGEEVTLDEAEKYLDDHLKDRFEKNFVFSYPQETE